MDTTNYYSEIKNLYDYFFDGSIFSSISSDSDNEEAILTTGSGACTNTLAVIATDSANSHTTFDELADPIMTKAKQIEESREKHHKETFTFLSFVRLLIYYFCGKVNSGRKLITSIESEDQNLNLEPVPRSTFFYAFSRFPAEWFRSLFVAMLSQISWKSIPELDLLGQLYVCDGSIFPLPINIEWAEYKSNSRALKLHLCFNLNKMIPVDIYLDTANSSERDALRGMLQKGITYIADRGYVCFTLLADIAAAQAFFVIRMYCNLSYTVTEPLVVNLPSTVKHIFELVTDQKIKLNGAEGENVYRLVTFWVGDEKYLILTNRFDLTTFQIILLYAYRWQVELIFRFLKRSMNGLHILSTSQNGSQIHFYMLLCTALLQLHLKQKCLEQNNLPQGAVTDDNLRIIPQIDQNQSSSEQNVIERSQQIMPESDNSQSAGDERAIASFDGNQKSSQSESCSVNQEGSEEDHATSVVDQTLLNHLQGSNQSEQDHSIKIAGLMVDPELLAGTRGQTFLATIGSKLDRYWKISVHWLVKLRNHLHKSFSFEIMISLATAEP